MNRDPAALHRCPACGAEWPGREFKRPRTEILGRFDQRRQCPGCAHIAPPAAFVPINVPVAPVPAGPRPSCRGVRQDGAPCSMAALSGSGFCRWHGPAELRRMG